MESAIDGNFNLKASIDDEKYVIVSAECFYEGNCIFKNN